MIHEAWLRPVPPAPFLRSVGPAGRSGRPANPTSVTVLTERDRRDYERALRGSGVRLECIPNGIAPRDAPCAAYDASRLVAAGRLTAQKGFDLLLDAFAQVTARQPDWTLAIDGAGPWRRLTDQRDTLGWPGSSAFRV